VLLNRSQGYHHCLYTIHTPKISSLQIQGKRYRGVEDNIVGREKLLKVKLMFAMDDA
jgi:hypothetical protein